MTLTYTENYKIMVWKKDQIIDLILFKTYEEVRQWKKEHPDIHLKYECNDKITYTLEQ
jgi:hypothetical protein